MKLSSLKNNRTIGKKMVITYEENCIAEIIFLNISIHQNILHELQIFIFQ